MQEDLLFLSGCKKKVRHKCGTEYSFCARLLPLTATGHLCDKEWQNLYYEAGDSSFPGKWNLQRCFLLHYRSGRAALLFLHRDHYPSTLLFLIDCGYSV